MTACLCGTVTFSPTMPSARIPASALGQGCWINAERRVHIVEVQRPERGVVHSRRRRVCNRVANDAEHSRRPGNHSNKSSMKQLAISMDSRHDTL